MTYAAYNQLPTRLLADRHEPEIQHLPVKGGHSSSRETPLPRHVGRDGSHGKEHPYERHLTQSHQLHRPQRPLWRSEKPHRMNLGKGGLGKGFLWENPGGFCTWVFNTVPDCRWGRGV